MEDRQVRLHVAEVEKGTVPLEGSVPPALFREGAYKSESRLKAQVSGLP